MGTPLLSWLSYFRDKYTFAPVQRMTLQLRQLYCNCLCIPVSQCASMFYSRMIRQSNDNQYLCCAVHWCWEQSYKQKSLSLIENLLACLAICGGNVTASAVSSLIFVNVQVLQNSLHLM